MKATKRLATIPVLGLALGGVLIGGSQIPRDATFGARAPSASEPASQELIELQPVSASELVCPGPEQQGLAESAVPEQDQTVRIEALTPPEEALPGLPLDPGNREGLVSLTGAPDATNSATNAQRGEVSELLLGDSNSAVVTATGELAPGLSAWQSHLSFVQGQRGLELTQCAPTATEHWLASGGGEPARLERLVLINPAADPVTVDISVFGADGLVSGTGSPGSAVVVPGNSRAIVLLDAIAPAQSSPVVRVSATQGEVSAYLGDRWMEGTTGAGLELSGGAAEPAMSQSISGLVIEEDSQDALLRVAVPGIDSGIVEVTAFNAEGPVELQQDVTVVEGEQVAEVSLADLPAGTYGLQVTSDVAVVAAAQSRTAPGEDDETGLAWTSASPTFSGTAGVPIRALAEGNSSWSLHLASSEADGSTVSVARVDSDGKVSVETLTVAAQQLSTLDLTGTDQAWLFDASPGVHATVGVKANDDIGTLSASAPIQGGPTTRGLTQVRPELP